MSTTCLTLYQTTNIIPPTLTDNNGENSIEEGTWLLEQQCSGVNEDGTEMTFEEWKDVWKTELSDGRFCSQVFNDIIHSNPQSVNIFLFNPVMFERVNNDMEYMMSKYFNATENGRNLLLPGAIGWDNFQNTLVTACRDNPGSCSKAQESLCTGCTREQISNNPDLLTLCGCYAPELDPTIYTREIPVECDPLCSRQITARRVDPETGKVTECNDTVCVMDNISITATKSSVSGVQISQMCPGCTAETGCKCIVDVSVTNLSASLGLDTPSTFQQYCPAEFATCINIDSVKQTSTVVPCDTYFDGTNVTNYDSSIPTSIYIIMFIVAILVILSLTAYIYSSKNIDVVLPLINSDKNIAARELKLAISG